VDEIPVHDAVVVADVLDDTQGGAEGDVITESEMGPVSKGVALGEVEALEIALAEGETKDDAESRLAERVEKGEVDGKKLRDGEVEAVPEAVPKPLEGEGEMELEMELVDVGERKVVADSVAMEADELAEGEYERLEL
jgi:hypothetical protein